MSEGTRQAFGLTKKQEPVEQITLDNGSISCQILTYGATLRRLWVPDRDGALVDVVLGYDTLEEYAAQDAYLGAVVGRYANRIAGGRFTLNGQSYALTVNNGPNHLHGGVEGFSYRVWTVEEFSAERAVLSLVSPDGDEGYPGRLKVKVTYALEGTALSIRYQAETDRDTVCSLTNHTYFNLAGHASGSAMDQSIWLHADSYTPTDETSIPYGRVEPVEGTPMDLRQPTALGAHIDEPFRQLLWARGYDHNYVICGEPGTLRPAAGAYSARTGILLEAETTLPGLQLYTANYLSDRAGKDGARYGERHAFCLETQFFPDSPNEPSFPSSVLRPGETYDHRTRFVFSTKP